MKNNLLEKDNTSPSTFIVTSAKKSAIDLRLIFIGIGLSAIGFTLGVNYQPIQQAQPKTEEIVTNQNLLNVATMELKPVDSYQVSRNYTGEVEALRSSDLSFEIGGKLIWLGVEEGQKITPQTIIAQLDTSNLEIKKQEILAQKAQAQAILTELQRGARIEQINGAKANVKNIQQLLELEQTKRKRREYLYQEGAISREQLDEIAFNTNALSARLEEAQSNLDELLAGTRPEKIQAQQAVIKQLEANLQDIELQLDKSTIKIPYEGSIAQRYLDEGTVISPGQPIVKLVENGKPEVRIGVPVKTVAQLTIGSTHQVEIADNIYQGKISAILPEVNPKTRTQTVVLQLDFNAAYQVAPGTLAKLELNQTVSTFGYWIPTTALVKGEKGLWSVYVVVKSEDLTDIYQVEKRDLEVLHTDNEKVLVRGTINSGDLIIYNGVHRVVSGQLVSISK